MMYQPNIISSEHITKIDYTKPSTMGKLFVAILLIVVFEGALRKWVTSELTSQLVLLRDCLALYGAYWAIKCGKMRDSRLVGSHLLWLWTVVVLLWGLLQLYINENSFLVFVVGVRFWLLYLWFAYAAAVSLTEADFHHIIKTFLWLLVIMVPLVVVQFYFPPSAFINKQLDDDESTIFRVTADIVRTTGTFSFTLGYTTFLAVVSPLVLALLNPGTRLWGMIWTPKAMVLALAVATMVSGSRSALIMFGLLFLAYIFISLRYSKAENKGSTLSMLVVIVFLLAVVPFVFSRAVDATLERFRTAAESEILSDRIIDIVLGEPEAYEKLLLIGNGIGAGNNFAGVLATGERTFLLAETEAARTILEGGLLGFVFIGLKLLVIFLGLRQATRIAKSTGNSLPLLLWLTLAIGLLTWSIIGQLTVNALGYMLLGLGIASLRLGADQSVSIQETI